MYSASEIIMSWIMQYISKIKYKQVRHEVIPSFVIVTAHSGTKNDVLVFAYLHHNICDDFISLVALLVFKNCLISYYMYFFYISRSILFIFCIHKDMHYKVIIYKKSDFY